MKKTRRRKVVALNFRSLSSLYPIINRQVAAAALVNLARDKDNSKQGSYRRLQAVGPTIPSL